MSQKQLAAFFVSALLLLLSLVACGNGGGPGTEEGSIVPCNQGLATSDVWQADFDPGQRQEVSLSVDTLNTATAAEYRLLVSCNDDVQVDTFEGPACSTPPPTLVEGKTPACPIETIAVADIDFVNRIRCLLEVTPTEPLAVGVGGCTDPSEARYKLRMTIDGVSLALDRLEDNCRTASSCLEDLYGVER